MTDSARTGVLTLSQLRSDFASAADRATRIATDESDDGWNWLRTAFIGVVDFEPSPDVANSSDIIRNARRQLDLGDVRVRFLLVGPTHTKGDTAFFVEGDNVLFAGDVVMNNSFLAATAVSSMKAWLAAFDTLEALKPQTIVPAHGEAGPGTIVATNRSIMQAVQARARALKAEGKSADEVATTVQNEIQAQHPGWPRANGLANAARSAYAESQ